jgi:transposase
MMSSAMPPPADTRKEGGMQLIHECCAGLDVHKASVVACVRRILPGGQAKKEVKTFGTSTRELLEMSDWLAQSGATHAAMESTGVFWKPIWNVLEGRLELLLANAKHIKNVPGRKTDVRDCEWIAQLLQFGLLSASFVPERPLRELRDLTRHRVTLIEERTRLVNRIEKVLEDADIKLGAVASDILGVSGRDMIRAIVRGEQDPATLANLARRTLRNKMSELTLALEGRITDHHRFLLGMLMEQVEAVEKMVERMTERIEATMRPSEEAVRRLATIPGVDQKAAQNILAEIGTDMGRFKTPAHLASWAGVSPGNNESAGKRKSGRTCKGNRWLRRTLCQTAWAAARTKGTYLQAQYRRLAGKRGKKRANLAVAHSILVSIHVMLTRNVDYRDLGGSYFDQRNAAAATRSLVRRLEALGHSVTLQPKVSA